MRGRGLLIALIASLALNLFLIFAGASTYLLVRHTPPTATVAARQRAVAALNPADRKAFVAMLRANGARVRPDNRLARALRDRAWSGLADGSETAIQIKQQLADARALNQTSRDAVEEAVVDFGLTLDPQERQALGRALRPVRK